MRIISAMHFNMTARRAGARALIFNKKIEFGARRKWKNEEKWANLWLVHFFCVTLPAENESYDER